MMVMEPRVAERRKSVSEDRARRRLKWILMVIVLVAAVLGALWMIRSPLLSIRAVEVIGAEQSDPMSTVQALGMGMGTPTIDVDAETIMVAVLEDPWVATASVAVTWPGSIVVEVVERLPVAPVLVGDEWALVALDGGVISMLGSPDTTGAFVDIDHDPLAPGDVVIDVETLGALAFIDRLTPGVREGTRVFVEGEGLYATVAGHRVRLGRPTSMAEKATVLTALLESGIAPGATIDLIAPLRPAVANPQPEPELEE